MISKYGCSLITTHENLADFELILSALIRLWLACNVPHMEGATLLYTYPTFRANFTIHSVWSLVLFHQIRRFKTRVSL